MGSYQAPQRKVLTTTRQVAQTLMAYSDGNDSEEDIYAEPFHVVASPLLNRNVTRKRGKSFTVATCIKCGNFVKAFSGNSNGSFQYMCFHCLGIIPSVNEEINTPEQLNPSLD